MLFVILAGIAIFVESLLNGWDHLTNLLQNNIWLIISMLILSAISRSCPLYLRNDQAFDTVSYTHLDVYKRQVQGRGAGVNQVNKPAGGGTLGLPAGHPRHRFRAPVGCLLYTSRCV